MNRSRDLRSCGVLGHPVNRYDSDHIPEERIAHGPDVLRETIHLRPHPRGRVRQRIRFAR
jgi:hypothetical protein